MEINQPSWVNKEEIKSFAMILGGLLQFFEKKEQDFEICEIKTIGCLF